MPERTERIFATLLILSVLLFMPVSLVFAQDIDIDELEAREEFGWGVRAYHRGYFQDAISSFNRAISLDAQKERYREWLGRAYFRSGLEQAAAEEWQGIVERGEGSLFLEEMLEYIGRRRSFEPDAADTEPYVFAREIDGRRGEIDVFRRPTSMLSRPDGSMLVVSFGTHEIAVLDVNGARVERWGGGLQGFDAPFDIAESGGNYFVTEFAADRISRLSDDGRRVDSFGNSGLGDGGLMGPQYIVSDGKGYIYVSDWGNRRIAKFDEDGEFITNFGRRQSGDFPGLHAPTGIAHIGSTVYVADAEHEAVYAFDENGNYLETLGGGRLGSIEGLSVFADSELVVVRPDRVEVLDVENDTVRTLSDFEGAARRVVSAVRDANGDIVATDFDANALFVLTERPSLYTGLRTYVERIDSDFFPRVTVDFRVEDRHGDPVVGLRRNNFVITEGSAAVENVELLYAGDTDRNPHVSLLISRAHSLEHRGDQIREIARRVHSAVTETGQLRLVVGGEDPNVALGEGTGIETFSEYSADAGEYSRDSRFDTAVRLAAGELLRSRGRRSVTYLGDGTLPESAFDTYSLDEVTGYLRNNGIRFDMLHVGSEGLDAALEYLVAETGGMLVNPEEARAMLPYTEEIGSRPSGRYVLQFESLRDGDFGRRYLPFEVEAALGRRSGRGESGYFAPFEY